MTLSSGDKIPSVTLKRLSAEGLEDLDIAEHIRGKRVVLFGVPGAFTPACTEKHLPGYIAKYDELKSQGIDEILCLHVNDPFVSARWSEETGADGVITLLPDGNAELTKELGLDFDGSGFGLGTRCLRFSAVVNDGVVETIEIEDQPTDVNKASAEACLVSLKKAA